MSGMEWRAWDGDRPPPGSSLGGTARERIGKCPSVALDHGLQRQVDEVTQDQPVTTCPADAAHRHVRSREVGLERTHVLGPDAEHRSARCLGEQLMVPPDLPDPNADPAGHRHLGECHGETTRGHVVGTHHRALRGDLPEHRRAHRRGTAAGRRQVDHRELPETAAAVGGRPGRTRERITPGCGRTDQEQLRIRFQLRARRRSFQPSKRASLCRRPTA